MLRQCSSATCKREPRRGGGAGAQEATPLVWNGAIYAITNWSVVFAVDARTGKELWRWDPEVNQTAMRSKLCCGVVSRGLALYDGKIIAPVERIFGFTLLGTSTVRSVRNIRSGNNGGNGGF